MNRLQINHMDGDQIQVEWQPERGQRRQYLNIEPFSDPLTDDDRSELRWYLEEYLGFPFGAERFRAEQVQKKMEGWGEELFRQVFLQSDAPLTGPVIYYQEAVRSGLDQCELAVVSNDSKFLNIPWELLRDSTAGRGYLAPALGGMFRQRTEHAIQVTPTISPDGPFRVLLVVARPFGETDVPLGTVARPVLEALRPLRDRIEVDVLRPPTFDTLQATLNSNRGYYNAVHFDGHGVFARTPSGVPLDQFGARGQMGHLVFETEDGGEQVVNSEQLGQALAAAHVPLFILNACQSAEEGDESSYSSVASQLVSIGASGVVAMSYSVYATSAARFMERFYQRLVEGDSLTSAVAAGRRGLYASPQHQSMIGELELQDWMVPALYQQEDGYIPIPQIETQPVEPDGEDGDGQLDLLGVVQKSCPEGQFGFIGRDYDILRIERSLRDDNRPWALLAGIGGTGKTEMAYGFARWYAETGGCPGGVFVASFREKTNFGQVIGSIAGFGTDFSRRTPEQQRQMLVNYLRENPCLLIWDNFETVAGFARESDLHATDDEKQSLSDFLRALRGGKSRVLITTRQPDENWLGIAYQLVEMGGLVRQDAAQMARIILDTVGKRLGDFRDDPDYAELLRLIRGHPRSLEVILPNLRSRTPGQIIEALQQRTDDLGEEMDDASLSFSFSRMSEGTQCHLPFIGLFASYVHADVIGNNFNSGDRGDVYREVMGETLEAEDWEAVLNEATRAGFVRLVGNRIYQLHPTIPAFLRRQLASVKGDEDLRRMDAEFMRFYAAWAATYEERMRNGDRNAVVAATIEEANLLRALRLAEAGNHWGLAGVMAPTFNYYYKLRGRREEWAALRFRLLAWTGREMAPDADQDRAFLWMFLLGNEANDAQARHDLDTSESAHKRILDYLTALDDEYAQPNIATSYHQLGNVDYYRQRFDEAEQWYRKALEIRERLGQDRNAANQYHQLGIIAEERQHFEKAEQWYKKALEVRERLGLEREAADDHIHLGNIAKELQHFEEAEQWYRKALEIFEGLGLEQDAAGGYHGLGNLADVRLRFEEAEQWFRKALEIYERLDLEPEASVIYHQLGIIAQERQRFDEAEQWYRKALENFECLGNRPAMVDTLAQLGVLRNRQNRLWEAVSWYGQALSIAAEYQMLVAEQILGNLGLILKDKGEKEFTDAWKQAFDGENPPIDALKQALEQLEGGSD